MKKILLIPFLAIFFFLVIILFPTDVANACSVTTTTTKTFTGYAQVCPDSSGKCSCAPAANNAISNCQNAGYSGCAYVSGSCSNTYDAVSCLATLLPYCDWTAKASGTKTTTSTWSCPGGNTYCGSTYGACKCTRSCSGIYWCDTSCNEWTTALSCPSNTCVKGSTKIATNTSACNGVGGLSCPMCFAGTGSTRNSCGGHASYQCTSRSSTGGTCCDYTYRCSGSSCVSACHAGVAVSYCGGCCSTGYTWNGSTCVSNAPPVNGVCGATHFNCTQGTSTNNVTGASSYTWTCTGSNGGTNASCSEPIPTCNSGITCGSCSIVSPSCGTGSQTCTYTTYTGGGTCAPASAPPQSCTVGCSPGYSCSGGTCVASSTININVYYDYNGNGVQDPGETAASGQTVRVTGGGAQTYTTNGVIKTISNLSPGSSTISVTLPNATWKSTTTNPVTVSYPPPSTQTVNVGIQPPAPTCSGAGGGLTASPTSVSPGGTSTLTAAGCTSPTGGALSYTYYDDSTIAGDSVTNNNTNTSTWTAPNPYWTQTVAHPSVAVCNPGGAGALCSNYGTSITIVPVFSVSGNVFVDANKNELKDAGESNFTPITITSTGGSVTYPSGGVFKVNSLPAGNYTISYTSLPSGSGYQMTFPINGPPPSFNVTVGAGCAVGISNSASCDANNNIINLNYGITNSIPWIQTIGGGDVGGDGSISSGGSGTAGTGGTTGGGGTGGTGATGGFNNPIPSTALAICGGPYSSIPGNTSTTPGLIFTGNGSAYFGQGSASLNNWLVGGTNYPESFGPTAQGGLVKTSYAYLQSIAKEASITPTDILPFCGAGGLNGCNLNFSTLPHGIYIANGTLTLTGNGTPSTYTFPSSQSYIILVGKNLDGSNGNLNIQTQLHVPVGSTALFSASGNITVDKSVGETGALGYQSSNPDIEGVFSADQSFIINGQGDCTIGPDLKLNVAGSIITNAALNGGTFTNQRDLCANNIYCPVFTIQSRPDFILNAPNFIKKANYTWQELAP